ncbi:MAG: hypothetical protein LUG57_11070, partial [Oscillospiraceae bacterium]|nr:hypothetical protein [Oscillospiraceae bacterium]
TSTVNGTITVLDSGIIMVEPLEGEASGAASSEEPAAAGDNAADLEAYKDYLREQLAADGGPDEFKAEMNAQIDSAETTGSENFATLIEFGIAVSYDNWAAGMLETSGAPVAY